MNFTNNLIIINNGNASLNYTNYENETLSPSLLTLSLGVIALCLIVITAVSGNTLVILSITNYRPLQKVQNLLLISLAVADLAVSVTVMPFHIVKFITGKWIFGFALCQAWITFDIWLCTASIFNLVAIAVDRYFAIQYPIAYAAKRTQFTIIGNIVIVWTTAGLISIPPLLGWNDWSQAGLANRCDYTTETGFVIYSACGSFFVPLIIMLAVYIRIFTTARSRIRKRLRTSGIAASIRRNKKSVIQSWSQGQANLNIFKKYSATNITEVGTTHADEVMRSSAIVQATSQPAVQNISVVRLSDGNLEQISKFKGHVEITIESQRKPEVSLVTADMLCNIVSNDENHQNFSNAQCNLPTQFSPVNEHVITMLHFEKKGEVLDTSISRKNSQTQRSNNDTISPDNTDTIYEETIIDDTNRQNCAALEGVIASPTSCQNMAATLLKEVDQIMEINNMECANQYIIPRSYAVSDLCECITSDWESVTVEKGHTLTGKDKTDIENIPVSLFEPQDSIIPSQTQTRPKHYGGQCCKTRSGCGNIPVILNSSQSKIKQPFKHTANLHIDSISQLDGSETHLLQEQLTLTGSTETIRGRKFGTTSVGHVENSKFGSCQNWSNIDHYMELQDITGNNDGEMDCNLGHFNTDGSFVKMSNTEKIQPCCSTGINTQMPENQRSPQLNARRKISRRPINLNSSLSQNFFKLERISVAKERKAAKTLAIIMGAFVACWLPFFTFYVLSPFCEVNGRFFEASNWLGYINSCLNPIIYTIFNEEFRKAFRENLRKITPMRLRNQHF